MFATFETSQHHTCVNCNYMVNNITKQTIWIGFYYSVMWCSCVHISEILVIPQQFYQCTQIITIISSLDSLLHLSIAGMQSGSHW